MVTRSRWSPFVGLLLLPVALVLAILGGCTGSPFSPTNGDAYPTHPSQIYIDGEGSDWDSLSVHERDLEDGEELGIDRLWTAHTDRHLFLRIALNGETNLQEGNQLALAIDTDHDSTTGRDTMGVGAELTWRFGDRTGSFRGHELTHADIGLTSLPTVRDSVFEVALDRTAMPDDSVSLFQGDRLRMVLSTGSDRLPDGEQVVRYRFQEAPESLQAPTVLEPGSSDVRLVSYNAVNNFDRERNSLFIDDRQPAYRRILGAVGADVIGFQEVYDQSAGETETVVEDTLGVSEVWDWAKEGQDLVLGSRFPIVDTHAIEGYEEYQSGAFLLDAESALEDSLLVVLMHPPCCNTPAENVEPSSDGQRQQVVDGVVAFLRDVRKGNGPFGVASETPIVVMGDMNFVGDPQQPTTLETGKIVHNERFGPSSPPDWDGSDLLDTNPRQAGSPMHTTWVDSGSSFPPGRLDYVYVTDSVLDVAHAFVLYTPALSEHALTTHDLRAGDTNRASDHLPVVVDVRSRQQPGR